MFFGVSKVVDLLEIVLKKSWERISDNPRNGPSLDQKLAILFSKKELWQQIK